MPRYFLEVAYKGTNYAGFQIQRNAITIQSEIERAMQIVMQPGKLLQHTPSPEIKLVGSSRTDAGVHAAQNFFHFDWPEHPSPKLIYQLNAILPKDIAVISVREVGLDAHCRFDALGRQYQYRLHTKKNPFLTEVSTFYPYKLDIEALAETASTIKSGTNFFAFAKTNAANHTYNCLIYSALWFQESENSLVFEIYANRFLRGMVRLLVGTQLKVGRDQLSQKKFTQLFAGVEKAGYAAPATGLQLQKVNYPDRIWRR